MVISGKWEIKIFYSIWIKLHIMGVRLKIIRHDWDANTVQHLVPLGSLKRYHPTAQIITSI